MRPARVINDLQSQSGVGGHCVTQGHTGTALRNRVSNWGLWEADFIISRR